MKYTKYHLQREEEPMPPSIGEDECEAQGHACGLPRLDHGKAVAVLGGAAALPSLFRPLPLGVPGHRAAVPVQHAKGPGMDFRGNSPWEVHQWREAVALVGKRKMRYRNLVLLVCVYATVVIPWQLWRSAQKASREDFNRLLKGDDQVSVSSMVLEGQGKRVVLDNPEITSYLTAAFRSPKRSVSELWSMRQSYLCQMEALSAPGCIFLQIRIPW
jgi:hypothetical protein